MNNICTNSKGRPEDLRAVACTYLTIIKIINNLNVLFKKYYCIRTDGPTHTHTRIDINFLKIYIIILQFLNFKNLYFLK